MGQLLGSVLGTSVTSWADPESRELVPEGTLSQKTALVTGPLTSTEERAVREGARSLQDRRPLVWADTARVALSGKRIRAAQLSPAEHLLLLSLNLS